MTGGVIAANVGTKGGGVYIAEGGTFNMSGGVISGNQASVRANQAGGGGIYNDHGTLNISGNAYITNNSYSGEYIDKEPVYDGSTLLEAGDKGQGTHGGGGVASCGGTVTMTGGYVTGNYSEEAGGGMYIGYNDNGANFKMRGGIVASNYCEHSEGGGIRISGGTDGLLEATDYNVIHITNNITNTTNDWGGGGIFIQANGLLTVYSSIITDNTARGFGGGVAGCPTGTILVVKTNGTAIYQNSADGSNFSGGTGGKADDRNTLGLNESYNGNKDTEFLNSSDGSSCYQDYYCVHGEGNTSITMVLGEMLGGESASWEGRIDGEAISIPKTGYYVANWLCGLTSHAEDTAIEKALDVASVYISGNTSNIHGGGIMSNGNLVLGDRQQYDSVCPPLVVKGTKTLDTDTTLDLNTIDMTQFKFLLLDKEPTLVNGKWTYDTANVIGSATADSSGSFTLTTEADYEKEGTYTYYLIEETGSDINIIYDTRMYTINVVIVKDTINILGVSYTAYRVNDVTVDGKSAMDDVASDDSGDGDVGIQLLSLDDDVSTQSVSSYTITYDNSDTKWSNVYIYTWDDSNKVYTGEWPGTLMSTTDGKTYTYTLHNMGEKYVIFNNGTHEEGDTEEAAQTGNQYIDDLVSDDARDKAEKYTIYYDNTASQWEEVYIYSWGVSGETTGEWPGAKMTKGENNIYSYELPNRGEKWVIFSDGVGKSDGRQTSDLYIDTILENNSTYVSFSSSGVDSYTLQLGNAFTNKVMAPLNLKLTKMDSRYETDAGFANSVLEGAVFNLYEVSSVAGTDNSSTVYYVKDGNSYAVNTQSVGSGTSGTDGMVEFKYKASDSDIESTIQLKRGTTYYLKETTPPNGYEVAGPWIVEISSDADATATIYKADVSIDADTSIETCTKSADGVGTQFDKSGSSLIVFITKIPDIATAYTLPHTGGNGTLKFAIGGALLITGAGLLLWYRANKRRKEDIAST
jgi:LPXTG-motif cell wall-anchored protein